VPEFHFDARGNPTTVPPECMIAAKEETPLRIGYCKGGVTNTEVTPHHLTWDDLVDGLRTPKEGEKDGEYFTRCTFRHNKRNDENALIGDLVILDGDSRIDPQTGEIIKSAPDPELVHELLTDLDITHAIYSSHSNGPDKIRYRVVIPVIVTRQELEGLVAWLFYKLHAAQVWLNPVQENLTFSRPWFLPRTLDEKAASLYRFFEHDGGQLFPKKEALGWWSANKPAHTELPTIANEQEYDSHTPIGRFNNAHGPEWISKLLVDQGYTFAFTTSVNGAPAYRFLAPCSESGTPGVTLFLSKRNVWRVHSFHGEHDPLSGKASDAFELFTRFKQGGDPKAAVIAILEEEKQMIAEQVTIDWEALISGLNSRKIAQAAAEFTQIEMPRDALIPYEWVIDEFIYVGAMTITGTHGVGKTTSLVPLCLAVAGAISFESVSVSIPRKVVYMTEDPDQAWRIVYGAIKHLGADPAVIRERFHMMQARRKPVDKYVGMQKLAEQHMSEEFGQQVFPLIVYDTASACFDLENESDNSEAGRVVSRLREYTPKCPIWIVTHVAKAVARANVIEQSSRGAGAWEADVQGVFRLFVDEDETTRVLYGGIGVKRRDEGSVKELAISSFHHDEQRRDRFGQLHDVPYPHVIIEASTKEAREKKVKEQKKAKKNQSIEQAKTAISDHVNRANLRQVDAPEQSINYPTKNTIETDDRLHEQFSRSVLRAACKEMLEEGSLIEVNVDNDVVKKTKHVYLRTQL
jgi:hypothetical protein